MTHNIDMEPDQALQKAQDEEQAFLRCVELAQMARDHHYFSAKDVEDLIYHLGVREHFKEKA